MNPTTGSNQIPEQFLQLNAIPLLQQIIDAQAQNIENLLNKKHELERDVAKMQNIQEENNNLQVDNDMLRLKVTNLNNEIQSKDEIISNKINEINQLNIQYMNMSQDTATITQLQKELNYLRSQLDDQNNILTQDHDKFLFANQIFQSYQQLYSKLLTYLKMNPSLLSIDLTQSFNLSQYTTLYNQQYEIVNNQLDTLLKTNTELHENYKTKSDQYIELKNQYDALELERNQYKTEKEGFYQTICSLLDDFKDIYSQFQSILSGSSRRNIQNPLLQSSILERSDSPSHVIEYYKQRNIGRQSNSPSSTPIEYMKKLQQQHINDERSIEELHQFINKTSDSIRNMESLNRQIQSQMNQYEILVLQYQKENEELKKTNDVYRLNVAENTQLVVNQLKAENERIKKERDELKVSQMQSESRIRDINKKLEEYEQLKNEYEQLKSEHEDLKIEYNELKSKNIESSEVFKLRKELEIKDSLIKQLSQNLEQLDEKAKNYIQDKNYKDLLAAVNEDNNELKKKNIEQEKEMAKLRKECHDALEENNLNKNIQKQYQELTTRYNNVIEQYNSLLSDRTKLLNDITVSNDRYQSLQQNKLQIDEELKHEKELNAQLKQQIEELKNDQIQSQLSETYLDGDQSIQNIEQIIHNLQQEKDELNIRINTLEKENRALTSLNRDHNSLDVKYKSIVEEKNRLETLIIEKDHNIESLTDQIKKTKVQLNNLENEKKEMNKYKNECDVYRQNYKDLYQLYDQLQTENQQLRAEYHLYNSINSNTIENDNDEVNQLQSKIHVLETSLDYYRQEYEELNSKYKLIQSQYNQYQADIQKQLNEKDEEISKLQHDIENSKQKEIDLQNRIQTLQNERDRNTNDLRNTLTNSNELIREIESVIGKYTELNKENEDYKSRILEYERRILEYEQRINNLNQQVMNTTQSTEVFDTMVESSDDDTFINDNASADHADTNDDLINKNRELRQTINQLREQIKNNNNYKDLYNQLSEKINNNNNYKDLYNRLQQNNDELNKKYREINDLYLKTKTNNTQLEIKQRHLDQLYNKLEQDNKSLKETIKKDQQYNKSRIETYEKQISNNQLIISSQRKEISDLQVQIYTIQSKPTSNDADKQLIDNLQNQNSILIESNKKLQENQQQLQKEVDFYKNRYQKYKSLNNENKLKISELYKEMNDVAYEIRYEIDSILSQYNKEIDQDSSIIQYDEINSHIILSTFKLYIDQIDTLLKNMNDQLNSDVLLKRMDEVSEKCKSLVLEVSNSKQTIMNLQLTQQQHQQENRSLQYKFNQKEIQFDQIQKHHEEYKKELDQYYMEIKKNADEWEIKLNNTLSLLKETVDIFQERMNECKEKYLKETQEIDQKLRDVIEQKNKLQEQKEICENEITAIYDTLYSFLQNQRDLNESQINMQPVLPLSYKSIKSDHIKNVISSFYTWYKDYLHFRNDCQYYKENYELLLSQINTESQNYLNILNQNKSYLVDSVKKQIEKLNYNQNMLQSNNEKLDSYYKNNLNQYKQIIKQLENQISQLSLPSEQNNTNQDQKILQLNETISKLELERHELQETNKALQIDQSQYLKVIDKLETDIYNLISNYRTLETQYQNAIHKQTLSVVEDADNINKLKAQSDAYLKLNENYTQLWTDYTNIQQDFSNHIEALKERYEQKIKDFVDYIDQLNIFNTSEPKDRNNQLYSNVYSDYVKLQNDNNELRKINENLILSNKDLLHKNNHYEKNYKNKIHIDDLIHDMALLLNVHTNFNDNQSINSNPLINKRSKVEYKIKQIEMDIKQLESKNEAQDPELLQKYKNILVYYKNQLNYYNYLMEHSIPLEQKSLNTLPEYSYIDTEANVSIIRDDENQENSILSFNSNSDLSPIPEEDEYENEDKDDFKTVKSDDSKSSNSSFNSPNIDKNSKINIPKMNISTFLYRWSCITSNVYPLHFLLQLNKTEENVFNTKTVQIFSLYDIIQILGQMYIYLSQENEKLQMENNQFQTISKQKDDLLKSILSLLNKNTYPIHQPIHESNAYEYLETVLATIKNESNLDNYIRRSNELERENGRLQELNDKLENDIKKYKENEVDNIKKIEILKNSEELLKSDIERMNKEKIDSDQANENEIKELKEAIKKYKEDISSITAEKRAIEDEKNRIQREYNQLKSDYDEAIAKNKNNEESQQAMNREGSSSKVILSAYTVDVGLELIKFFKAILKRKDLSLDNSIIFKQYILKCQEILLQKSDLFDRVTKEYQQLYNEYKKLKNIIRQQDQVINTIIINVNNQNKAIERFRSIFIAYVQRT